ncbi:MAG: hypothetical protein FJ098_15015, partial [Deltaproteobacteria bacterium]|nr:hypothetical protein [Deltaproteobacteria bacterium]
EVLGCETLAGIRFENALPMPNVAAGQTYASLTDSFLEGGGQALRMDFVPSSLGWMEAEQGSDGELRVTMLFPEPLSVDPGELLVFDLLPGPAVSPGPVLRPVSDFVTVRPLGAAEVPLGEWPLAILAQAPGVPVQAVFPGAGGLELQGLCFSMDLFLPGLPLEQVLRITVDRIRLQAGL